MFADNVILSTRDNKKIVKVATVFNDREKIYEIRNNVGTKYAAKFLKSPSHWQDKTAPNIKHDEH